MCGVHVCYVFFISVWEMCGVCMWCVVYDMCVIFDISGSDVKYVYVCVPCELI